MCSISVARDCSLKDVQKQIYVNLLVHEFLKV